MAYERKCEADAFFEDCEPCAEPTKGLVRIDNDAEVRLCEEHLAIVADFLQELGGDPPSSPQENN